MSILVSNLKEEEKLVALILLFYRCIVTIKVLWLFLAMPCVCLQYVIVVFPDHTRLLFNEDVLEITRAGVVLFKCNCIILCYNFSHY